VLELALQAWVPVLQVSRPWSQVWFPALPGQVREVWRALELVSRVWPPLSPGLLEPASRLV